MRIDIGLSTSWRSLNNGLTLTLMFIDSIILPSPRSVHTWTAYLSHVKRWKPVKSVPRKNEGCGESKSFISKTRRHYEHIYPKLKNNEERLKPSQYFRYSKWTTSPAVDNGTQRVPDTIMGHKCERENMKASLQERGRETWMYIPFNTCCVVVTRQEISAHCL